MLKISAYNGMGGSVVKQPATFVCIEDGHGNPIFVAATYGGNLQPQIIMAKVGDPDFANVCKLCGIDKVVVCENMSTSGGSARPGEILIARPR